MTICKCRMDASAANVPTALAKAFGFYLVFTHLSTCLGNLTEGAGANDFIILIVTMLQPLCWNFCSTSLWFTVARKIHRIEYMKKGSAAVAFCRMLKIEESCDKLNITNLLQGVSIMAYLFVWVIGYLLGCSNLAHLLAKMKGVDLASGGSGNPGASNATILMGWRAGFFVAIHDAGKALVAVILAKILFPETDGIAVVAGAACVLGHIFPIFLKFKGGKGFASYIGMMLALNWKFALIVIVAVVLITIVLDYLVIGTTVTVLSLPVYLFVISAGWISIVAACTATVVIICKHRVNYVRIFKGTEIGLRSTMSGKHRVR